MKAYVTSIGERTTQVCVNQLRRLGFEVIVLDGVETWQRKYRKFLNTAQGPCIRVDADVIVGDGILEKIKQIPESVLMAQFTHFDAHSHTERLGQPVYYSQEVLGMLHKMVPSVPEKRCETWAWRLPNINPRTMHIAGCVASNGFYQRAEDVVRHAEHRAERKHPFDSDLVTDLQTL